MPSLAVVFVHGVLSSPATWERFRTLLANDPDMHELALFAFGYPSPILEPDPRRRIPDYDAIADALGLFIDRETETYDRLVLVTHSQGGLIAQRYLAQMLESGRGTELQRIAHLVMFSCPNDGADFLLGIRKSLWPWRHAQERQLRPLNEQVAHARRVVIERAVHAKSVSPSTCPIPVSAYAGLSDNIVKRSSAKGLFLRGGSLPGDHNSIIQPPNAADPSYKTLRRDLLQALVSNEPESTEGSVIRPADTPPKSVLLSLPSRFLSCRANPEHECDFRYPWCRALSDNTISLSHYVTPRVRVFAGRDGESTSVPVDDVFNQWLGGGRRNLLLLGEYGAGKTSASLYLYRRMAEALQRDPTAAAIPIYISLDAFSRGTVAGPSLQNVLQFSLNLRNGEFSDPDLHSVNGSRRVYILDGLDEMGASASVSAIRANLAILKPFFSAHTRVLLTCRTHLFASATDLETALSGSSLAGDLLEDIRATHGYLIAELQNLSPLEVIDIIRLSHPSEDPVAVWQEMGSYYDLQDLSRRPILLGLILQSLPVLRERSKTNRRINEAGLYDAYLHSWTLRELSNKRLPSEPETKLRLAEAIAAIMYRLESSSVDRETLTAEVRRHYGDQIFSNADFQLFDYDTRDASFLTCNLSAEFHFLHHSFYEFFAARAFMNSVRLPSRTGLWGSRWLTKEVASFGAQLLSQQSNHEGLRAVLNMALGIDDPIELWNALHLISLLSPGDLGDADVATVASSIVPRGVMDTRAVLVRQYARVAAKFVSNEAGENLIRRVLAIIADSDDQQLANDNTYINYYGGVDAACAACLSHTSSQLRKYDRLLHIHVLGQLGSPVHADTLADLASEWNEEDFQAVQMAVALIHRRRSS